MTSACCRVLMIQAGYPPKMLQEIMEHASITTTLDVYGHLYPRDMDRYADRLDSAALSRIRPESGQMMISVSLTMRRQPRAPGAWLARSEGLEPPSF